MNGASFWISSVVPATLRLWHSSPMCSACDSRRRRSISPAIFIASRSIGPSTSRIQSRRTMTLSSFAPILRILAICSLRLV